MEQTENILHAPARYHLVDCLRALKFGRPAHDQQFLDQVIAELTTEPIDEAAEGSSKRVVTLKNRYKAPVVEAVLHLQHPRIVLTLYERDGKPVTRILSSYTARRLGSELIGFSAVTKHLEESEGGERE
jgi:hypothetical protein